MKWLWIALGGLVAYEVGVQAVEIAERWRYWRAATAYAEAVGKPVLRIGMHRSPFEPPNGDVTIDLDPDVLKLAGGVQGDERAMPFADKEFAVCLHPDSPVLIERGLHKRIADIRVGDKVVTHMGRLRRVTRTFERPYHGDLVIVKPHYAEQFAATPEHPVLTRTGQGSFWKAAGELSATDRVVLQVERRRDLAYPFAVRGFPAVPATAESAWLLGYWLGDGWADSSNQTICFSMSRATDIDRIERGMAESFNLKRIKGRVTATEQVVRFQSAQTRRWFTAFFGQVKARSKSIPPRLFYLPPDEAAACLEGMVAADGHRPSKTALRYMTSSSSLASQVASLVIRAGSLPSTFVRTAERQNGYNGFHANGPGYQLAWSTRLAKYGTAKRPSAKIASITRQLYSGPVHNLAVEEDDTYVVGYTVVHNCFNEHTLEHLHTADDVRAAMRECVRVADYAVFLVPSDLSIWARCFNPTHYLVLRFDPAGRWVEVADNQLRTPLGITHEKPGGGQGVGQVLVVCDRLPSVTG